MEDSYLLTNILVAAADLLLVAASAYGIVTFFAKKSPLYFRILTLATICYTGTAVFRALYWICYQEDFAGMGITIFGILGCYLFLFSANFGQYDSLIDDRSARFRKYRLIAFIAPAALFALLLLYTLGNAEETTRFNNVVTGIGFLPAVAASYYNFKHFIVPDMDFSFVKWVRRANLCALVIEFTDIVRVLLFAKVGDVPGSVAGVIVAGAFLSMLLFAERGRRSWFR